MNLNIIQINNMVNNDELSCFQRSKRKQTITRILLAMIALVFLLVHGTMIPFPQNTHHEVTIVDDEGLLQPHVESSPVYKQRLEFVHITKTGGSTIESIAAKHGIIWGACHFSNNTMIGCYQSQHVPWREYYIGTAWHAPPKVINALLPIESNPYHGADLFVVVRNPYDRAISEYYCPFFGMEGASHNSDAKVMNQWIQRMIQSLNEHPIQLYYKSPTMPKYPSKKHYLNQVEYIFNLDGTRVVKNVLYYENLSQEFNDLMEEYNLPMLLTDKKKDGINTSSPHVKKRFSVKDLNAKTIQMINDYAEKDFRQLGYRMVHDNFGEDYHLEAANDHQ